MGTSGFLVVTGESPWIGFVADSLAKNSTCNLTYGPYESFPIAGGQPS